MFDRVRLEWVAAVTAIPLYPTLLAIALLAVLFDTFVHPLSYVAAFFVALVMAPLLFQIVKGVRVPSRFAVELRDQLALMESRMGTVGLAAATASANQIAASLASEHPALSLAALRIEIERRLKRIAALHGRNARFKPVQYVINDLNQADVLSLEQVSVLSDLLPLLNLAIHADGVNEAAAQWALVAGPKLIAGLDAIALQTASIPSFLSRDPNALEYDGQSTNNIARGTGPVRRP